MDKISEMEEKGRNDRLEVEEKVVNKKRFVNELRGKNEMFEGKNDKFEDKVENMNDNKISIELYKNGKKINYE